MMDEIRFGVIGLQWAGKTHAGAISQTDGARVAAVSDINEDTAKTVAEEYEVDYHTNYKEMLSRKDIDAVSICTPHWLHYPMAIAAIKAGKHVVVEKPIAITVSEADRMIKAARDKGVKLAVSHQYRLHKPWWSAKQCMEKLGKLYRASLVCSTPRTQQYYDSGTWRGTWSQEGGGVLINQSVHHIDFMLWMMGPVKRLSAQWDTFAHDIEVEDAAAAVMRLENGGIATFQMSTADFPGGTIVEFAGENGTLRITDKVQIALAPDHKWEEIEPQMSPLGEGHAGIIRDFVAAINDNREPFVNGEQGRAALEIVNAIILSGSTGKTLDLPINRIGYNRLIGKLKGKRNR